MKTIIPALDVPTIERALEIIKQCNEFEVISGYKVGLELCLKFGAENVLFELDKATAKEIIFDGQKFGNDIPEQAERILNIIQNWCNKIIIFPMAGPTVMNSWIDEMKSYGVTPIVGGEMTISDYLTPKGFIDEYSPSRIYYEAYKRGVRHFVVPGNKIDKLLMYKESLKILSRTEEDNGTLHLYSPGLITQGGSISETGEAAGDNWSCIIGRAIYESNDIKKTIENLSKDLV